MSKKDADETKKLNCFWQLNSNSQYRIWIFLTVVLTLQMQIKALGGDVICNYCSFCRNKPTSTASSPLQFVFQKVIVCPFKSGISAENFYRDVNQRSGRVETPGRGKFNLVNTQ